MAPHIQEHFVEVFMKSPQERGVGSHHGADRGNTTDLQEHVAVVFTMIGQERVLERVVELILPVPRTQDHVVEVFQGDTANAGVRTDGRGDCGGGAHHSSRAVEVWSAVEV